MIQTSARRRLRALQSRQKKLIAEWGDEVAGGARPPSKGLGDQGASRAGPAPAPYLSPDSPDGRIPWMDCQFDDLLERFCYKNQCNTIIATGQIRLIRRVNPESLT